MPRFTYAVQTTPNTLDGGQAQIVCIRDQETCQATYIRSLAHARELYQIMQELGEKFPHITQPE